MSARILIGDCRVRMAELPDASVDSVVCDPPYHLTSIVKRFGAENAAPAKVGKTGAYARASKGFMGQTWDGGDVAFDPETWAEVLRVLKPGGHLVAFSGTRTYHRMAVAIEDAGFEIRDQLAYCYGSGFPKSLNLDKKIGDDARCICRAETLPECDLRLVQNADVSEAVTDRSAGGEILFEGLSEQGAPSTGRSQFPAAEVRAEEPGVEGRRLPEEGSRQLSGREVSASAGVGAVDGEGGRLHNAASSSDGADVRLPADANGSGEPQGSQPREQSSVEPGTVADERGPQTRGAWPICGGCGKPIIPEGLGTALKPAWEPICLARKPLAGTVAANVLEHGTGALNVDGCRIEAQGRPLREVTGDKSGGSTWRQDGGGGSKAVGETDLGRWPANLCHDGSDEVLAGFPETASNSGKPFNKAGVNEIFGKYGAIESCGITDEGSASRFFYCAKTTTEERGEGNNHPTVKPIALMRWLCRLVTPKGGTILDPFMGSGSTLIAADAEQFNAIGCEMSPDYAAIAERRLRDAGGMFAEVSVCLGEAA